MQSSCQIWCVCCLECGMVRLTPPLPARRTFPIKVSLTRFEQRSLSRVRLSSLRPTVLPSEQVMWILRVQRYAEQLIRPRHHYTCRTATNSSQASLTQGLPASYQTYLFYLSRYKTLNRITKMTSFEGKVVCMTVLPFDMTTHNTGSTRSQSPAPGPAWDSRRPGSSHPAAPSYP